MPKKYQQSDLQEQILMRDLLWIDINILFDLSHRASNHPALIRVFETTMTNRGD
jgi:hypothetical protein